MPVDDRAYYAARDLLVSDTTILLDLEERYTQIVLDDLVLSAADDMYRDFCDTAAELLPFWINYPPEQRGRKPTGESIPWLELGEKTVSSHIVSVLTRHFPNLTFPGLPTGGDIRFATAEALIHLDVKLTGPNDNPNEIVVPPNQISGDGAVWDKGILNSTWPVYYQTGRNAGKINYHFQPKLPPFYLLGDKILPCITLFLKVVYDVEGWGIHPLSHFELICVPNGLLMFCDPIYAYTDGLIISGKDERRKPDHTKRIRIRLDPLASIHSWRCIGLERTSGGWKTTLRVKNHG